MGHVSAGLDELSCPFHAVNLYFNHLVEVAK